MLVGSLALALLSFGSRPVASKLTPDHLQRVVESTVQLRTHSIFAPYVDQDLQNRWFSFGGDAYINTNKHIRLTQDRPSETGWLWSRLPISTNNFQIDIEFKISGGSSHLFGDGMAIWLTSRRAQSGPVFGFENKFEGIGIFIDTFGNQHHPYSFPHIMAMIGDGNTEYDPGTDGFNQQAGSCSANVRDLEIATKMRITYLKGHFLDVQLHHKAWDEWTPCFTLWQPKLPEVPFLGFSALTGELSEAHDIISVTTSSLVVNTDAAGVSNVHSGKTPSSEQGFFGAFFSFLLKLIFIGALVLVGVVGWRAYGAKISSSYGNGPMLWDAKRF